MTKPISISLVINAFAVPTYFQSARTLPAVRLMELTPSQGKHRFSSLYPGTV